MNMKTTVVYDQHEYSIETKGIFNNKVIFKIDKKLQNVANSGSTWDNTLFFEYIIISNNQKRKISIMLLKDRIWSSKQYIVLIYEKSIIVGIDLFKEYKIKYYKYMIARKKLLEKKLIYRIITLEWKKVLGYFIFGVLVLVILSMIEIIAFIIFGVSVIIMFSIIGIWDDKNLRKEVKKYES
jgi:hypothetical protein